MSSKKKTKAYKIAGTVFDDGKIYNYETVIIVPKGENAVKYVQEAAIKKCIQESDGKLSDNAQFNNIYYLEPFIEDNLDQACQLSLF